MMKNISLVFGLMLLFLGAIAQQEPTFTQYFVNDMAYNPAIAGSKTYNSLVLQTRQQWLGFEGAPFSTNISYHGAINNRSAMGGYFMFEQTTPSMQANLHLNYAYHVPLNYDKVNLSFGIGSKLMYYNLDFDQEDMPSGIDPAFSASAYEKILADVESGVYLYGRNFYVGYAAINLLQSSFNGEAGQGFSRNNELRNYYGMTGYRFRIINNDWQLEPSILLRHEEGQVRTFDISGRIFYLNNNWTGVTYCTNGTLAFVVGFLANNNMHIAYSYDQTLVGEIMHYNYGTHELSISFRIPTMASQRHIGFWGY